MSGIQVISVREHPQYLDNAVDYLARKWGISRNIYQDCVSNSLTTESPLPRWYLMMRDGFIIGSYGLIANDFISRQDLWPWLAALYVEENERGNSLGAHLLEHGRAESAQLGFPILYLSTTIRDTTKNMAGGSSGMAMMSAAMLHGFTRRILSAGMYKKRKEQHNQKGATL
jgi:GNAT superfamily N-acetyltransferase